jgi:DmsE family decaheme c-type cytochrome
MSRAPIPALILFVVVAGLAHAEDTVDIEYCEACHDELVPVFVAGPHGRGMAAQSEERLANSCVACHGSADEHVDDPTAENIVKNPGLQACLSCHPDRASKIELASPGHNRHGVACLDCHSSGHEEASPEAMLRDEPAQLCAECHQEQKAAFRLPFAHRDGSDPFPCTECHSTHGDTRVGRLEFLPESRACVECHTGESRPYVFPHPPVNRYGCVACHMPHGTTNPKLLTRRTMHLLCLECHSSVPSFHDITNPRYRNCQNCHTAIHGSNRDPRLFEE